MKASKQQLLNDLDIQPFEPDETYISLLQIYSNLSKAGVKNEQYRRVRRQLTAFEKELSSFEIIQNSKLAFKN
jgi:hypothetical protein